MEFDIEDFVAQPGLDKYNQCRKEDLFLIAAHFKVPVSKQDRKEAVKKQLHDALVDKNILPPISTLSHGATLPSPDHGLRKLELELEMRRLELKDRELQREFEFRKLELEENTRRESLRLSARSSRSNDETGLDVNKCVRMVPPFCEKDVDKYFVLFERVAVTLDWPKDIWPLLLQCVFTGKAQEAYASLSVEASANYEEVKGAVMRAVRSFQKCLQHVR